MADCNNCSSYLSSEDIIRRSVKCSGGSVAFIGSNVNQNEPEVAVYIDGLTTPLSSTELSLLNTMVRELKTGLNISDLSNFFDYIFLRNGETTEQSLRNLVKNSNHSTLKGTNIPQHIKNRGFRGDLESLHNLESSYIEIDYIPASGTNFKLNDASFGVYFNPYRVTPGGSSYYTGASKSRTARLLIGHWNARFITALNCGNTDLDGLTASSEFTECVIISRSAVGSYSKYRNGVQSTITANSTELPNYKMFELAANMTGAALYWNDHTTAMSFCAKAITLEQEAVIRNAFKTYFDAKNAIVEPINLFMLNGIETEVITTSTCNDIYNAYDLLVTANPSYITKTLLGQDAYTNNIYQYRFNPGTQSKKIIITTGVHGNEKGAVIQAYNFFKLLCENPGSDPHLSTLKNNIEYIIIPVVNPSGFNLNTRYNANNVDINRNFPYLWNAGNSFPGASAGSEAETQLVISWLNANIDADYFFENHNDSLTSLTGYIYTRNMGMEYRYREMINELIPEWQTNDVNMPQTSVSSLDETRTLLIKASLGIYGYSLGIPMIMLETASDVNQFGYVTPEGIFGHIYTRLATEKLTNLILQTNMIMNTP